MPDPKPKTKNTADRYRNAELAKIHIAKKEMGMDDDTYRDMLWILCGVRSAADLSPAQRKDVLEHLKSAGFERKKRNRPKNLNGQNSKTGQLKKIEALLTVGKRPWSYADALAKRICKVEKLDWVPNDQLYKIITALRKQAQREGWALEE